MSTGVTDHANGRPERKNGDRPAKQKFGLVLQGGGALGAYEVGAVEYLYERGMECAIVSGASARAMRARSAYKYLRVFPVAVTSSTAGR